MDVLNHYLSACADAILAEEGTLDKFMGDAVVALFNAPLPQSDHTLRALRAALRLREAARGLHPQMAADCRLEFGVGVSVGEAVVGNVGTWRRLDYTAIGASVNLARRLQEAAGPGQILMSEHVYRRVTESVEARAVPSIDLDGIDGPVMAYELVALRGSLAKRGGS
jgi:class 3 adenylate cyclase